MRKKLISLGLISVASVLAIAGCSTAATSRVNEPATVQFDGDHRDLPHYRADELPNDNEIYDLTKMSTYTNIRPATVAEFDEFLMSVAGPTLVNLVKETFPELYSYVQKHNILTQRELYDLAGIAGQIIEIIQGGTFDASSLLTDIATKVDLDKAYYFIRSIRNDKNAYAELKKFVISMNNGTFIPMDYRAANSNMTGSDLSSLATAEAKVWDNFKVGDDDYEIFERIQEFFNDDDVRVFLKFVNLFVRSLAKNLTKHELGFIFGSAFHIISDPEYVELCLRYMLNNADSFIHHVGAVFSGINITNNSWMMMLRGLHTFANKLGANADYFNESSFIGIDYIAQKVFEENTQFVIDSVDPHGVQVLVKFVGNFLKAMPREFVKSVVRNYVDNPDGIDYSVLQDVYYEQYGRLKGSDKAALVAQAERFNIDLEHLFEPVKPDPEPEIKLSTYLRYVRVNKSFALTAVPPTEETTLAFTVESESTLQIVSVTDNVCTVKALSTGESEVIVSGGGFESRCQVLVVGEDDQSPGLLALMTMLGTNVMEPFIDYFTNGLETGDIYKPTIKEEGYNPEDYIKFLNQPEFDAGSIRLIFRKGVDIEKEDIVALVNEDSSLEVEVSVDNHYYGTNTYKDRAYRSDFELEGNVNTSRVGDGYVILKYHVSFPIDMYIAPSWETHQVLHFEYDFEWKLFYYVIDSSIDVYTSGFYNELTQHRYDSYHTTKTEGGFVDSVTGCAAVMNYKNVLYVKKNSTFTEGELLLNSKADSIHRYDPTLKRYEEIADKDSRYYATSTYKNLSDIDTTTLGLHYGYYDKVFKSSSTGLDYCTIKMVYAYYVVEEVDFDIVHGFFDPGFGW